jgi:hypothetical protein
MLWLLDLLARCAARVRLYRLDKWAHERWMTTYEERR